MSVTIDATSFPDAEHELVAVLDAAIATAHVSNVTPGTITGDTVIVGFSGGGSRDWGVAAMNMGINLYAMTEPKCRALAITVQNVLATLSNDEIIRVATPAGGATSIPGQAPPFHRYFVVTVHLRGQAAL